jgi:hypothetical protein
MSNGHWVWLTKDSSSRLVSRSLPQPFRIKEGNLVATIFLLDCYSQASIASVEMRLRLKEMLSLVVAAAMVVRVFFEDQTPSNKRAFHTIAI